MNKNKVVALCIILIGIFGMNGYVHAEKGNSLVEDMKVGQRVIELEDRAERLRSETVQKLIKDGTPSQGLIIRDSKVVQKKVLNKKQFDESMSLFREARDDFNKNKSDAAKQKVALLKLVSGLKSRAALLSQRTEKLPVVNQELQDSLSSEAEAETAKFDEIESRIQGTNNSEALKALTVELRNRRDATGQKSRLLVLLAYVGVEENYYIKTVQAQIALVASGIQKLKANGKDTTSLDSLLAEAQVKSVEIQQKMSDAKTSIGTEVITDARLRELHGVIQGINDEIAATYGLLGQIIQTGKNL